MDYFHHIFRIVARFRTFNIINFCIFLICPKHNWTGLEIKTRTDETFIRFALGITWCWISSEFMASTKKLQSFRGCSPVFISTTNMKLANFFVACVHRIFWIVAHFRPFTIINFCIHQTCPAHNWTGLGDQNKIRPGLYSIYTRDCVILYSSGIHSARKESTKLEGVFSGLKPF